jgi:hypothetical protein
MTMRQSSRILWVSVAFGLVVSLGGGDAGLFGARAEAKAKSASSASGDEGPKHEVNACGCYKDAAGACFCGKKGKCSCPGDCEPKGCEEKRNKEMQKEVAAETKKAHEADQKQRSKEHASKEPKQKKPSGVGQ